jgi:hypothetical protein
MTLYPDPIKLKKYPILSQILTPFCPKIKGSIQFGKGKGKNKNAIGLTHNQGVPGSCPVGPTAERQYYQGFMLLKA